MPVRKFKASISSSTPWNSNGVNVTVPVAYIISSRRFRYGPSEVSRSVICCTASSVWVSGGWCSQMTGWWIHIVNVPALISKLLKRWSLLNSPRIYCSRYKGETWFDYFSSPDKSLTHRPLLNFTHGSQNISLVVTHKCLTYARMTLQEGPPGI